jgi:hypothetical protein
VSDEPESNLDQPHDPEEVEDFEEFDEPEIAGSDTDPVPSRRFDSWRRRSAIGAVASGIALGLQQVFAPPMDEPVLTAEAPGDPPDADQRLRVVLDPDDPTKSIAILPADQGKRVSEASSSVDAQSETPTGSATGDAAEIRPEVH